MSLGPLEYIVIAVRSDRFTAEVAPELTALQKQGAVRVVDLLFIEKDESGAVIVQEVDQLTDDTVSAYDGLADDLGGLLTPEDIERLAEQIPSGASAVVVLFEHTWAIALRAAIDRAGGTVLGGGMTKPEALKRLEAEIASQAGAS